MTDAEATFQPNVDGARDFVSADFARELERYNRRILHALVKLLDEVDRYMACDVVVAAQPWDEGERGRWVLQKERLRQEIRRCIATLSPMTDDEKTNGVGYTNEDVATLF
jgi:hypothetical protein